MSRKHTKQIRFDDDENRKLTVLSKEKDISFPDIIRYAFSKSWNKLQKASKEDIERQCKVPFYIRLRKK